MRLGMAMGLTPLLAVECANHVHIAAVILRDGSKWVFFETCDMRKSDLALITRARELWAMANPSESVLFRSTPGPLTVIRRVSEVA